MRRQLTPVQVFIYGDPLYCENQIVGTVTYQFLFDQLTNHLQSRNLLPDIFILYAQGHANETVPIDFKRFESTVTLADDGFIYLTISLIKNDSHNIVFLGRARETTYSALVRMNRICAECTTVLNAEIMKIHLDKQYADEAMPTVYFNE